jgi:hypothetical protein
MLSDQEETGPFPVELPLHPAGSCGSDGASARLFLGVPVSRMSVAAVASTSYADPVVGQYPY